MRTMGRQCSGNIITTLSAAFLFCLIATSVVLNTSFAADGSGMHLPNIDDFLKLEEVGAARPSPDGRLVAVEIRRSRSEAGEAPGHELPFARSDLWILDVQTRTAIRLTDGRADGAWHWGPMWSPSGERLAYLTYLPGGVVGWSVWTRSSGRTESFEGRGTVALEVNFGSAGRTAPEGQLAGQWLDDVHLLSVFSSHAEDALGAETEIADPIARMTALWSPTREGLSSVTVWDSAHLKVCGVDYSLATLNTTTGERRDLMEGPIRGVSVSPGAKYAAVIIAIRPRHVVGNSPLDMPLDWNAYNIDAHVDTGMQVVDLHRELVLGDVAGLHDLTFLSGRRFPRWADDETHFAVPSHGVDGSDHASDVRLPDRQTHVLDTWSSLDAEILSELLSLSTWGVATDSEPHLPMQFGEQNHIWGQEQGYVLRLPGRRVEVVAKGIATVLDSFGHVLQRSDRFDALGLDEVGAGRPRRLGLIRAENYVAADVPVDSADLDQSNEKTLVNIPRTDMYLSEVDNERGTFLWLKRRGYDGGDQVLALNEHLSNVISPQRIVITYKTKSGALRRGLILAPSNFLRGIRLPLVIEVYPSTVVVDRPVEEWTVNSFYNYSRHTLVGAGYLVLIPSIPWTRGESPLEPAALVTEDVLAAASAAISQGYAHKNRIGLLGHSYGGYSALAAATRTDLFKAIVVSALYSDLASYHDSSTRQFGTRECGPSAQRLIQSELEGNGATLGMRAPPMAALDRYLRNSPYFNLASMRTPTLLIHGDQDSVSDSNSERTFFELLRLGVPTQFARYWGEGHNFSSPGNIRDALQRTQSWFNIYLQ
jgi:dipeptidyl aminopeptidase/acylaminoacyl peptidase